DLEPVVGVLGFDVESDVDEHHDPILPSACGATRPVLCDGPTLGGVTIELSIENPCVPQAEADSSVRAVWNQLSLDATSSRNEPLIAGLVLDLIDGCDDLGESLARLAASRVATREIGRHVLEKEIRAVLADSPHVLEAVAAVL